MATYTRKVQAVARGLFSPEAAEQLAALQSLQAFSSPQPDEPDTTGKAFDDVRQACLAQGLGSLSRRLLELAAPTAPGEATQQQLASTAVASAVWKALWQCCRQPELQLRRDVLASPLLRPALAAALQDLEDCESSTCPQAFAMRVLECICPTDQRDQRPAWLSSFLPVAVKVLEVWPLTSTSDTVVCCALEMLWQHCAQPELQPLLPRVVAAVLDRQLHLQHPHISEKAAIVISVAASRRNGTAAARARTRSADLSAITGLAERAVPCTPWELGHVQIAMDLADHPSFQAHALQWLVPRLVATIYRLHNLNVTCALVGQLPELLRLRPELAEPLLAKGLLPALARLMVADAEDPSDCSRLVLVSYPLLMLADSHPHTFGVAAQNSQALQAALQYSFGHDLQTLQRLAPPPAQAARLVQKLQQMANNQRRGNGTTAAARASQMRQLSRLRICAWAGCSRVEDTRGSSLKACGACRDRAAAANGSNSSSSSSSSSRAHTGSSGGDVDEAAYCGRACQAADRFAGHAACLLAHSLKGVTLADATPQQRKHLLNLLGCADNSAKMATLEVLHRLFGPPAADDISAGQSAPFQAQRVMEWISAGFGTQLVAFMAALQQRRAWCSLADGAADMTAELLERVLSICYYLIHMAAVGGPASATGPGPTAQLQLHQQLCTGGAGWLAFALAEGACEHAKDRSAELVLLTATLCAVKLMQQCTEDSAGAGAMKERVQETLSRAATPAVLDAMADYMLQEVVEDATCYNIEQYLMLMSVVLQESAQMQHVARHPGFVGAVRLTLAQALPSASTLAWNAANLALKLLCMLCAVDQSAADALGAGAEQLLPTLFALLVQPFSRRQRLTLNATAGVRCDVAALRALCRSQAAVDAIRKSGWLIKHSGTRTAGWTDEEVRLMQQLMLLVHPEVKHGNG